MTKETWMASELATILHKLDKDAEEQADERERKQLLVEKEEERKRLKLEADLEERRREQERKHEMQKMQAMMFTYLQQLQYPNHNPSLYGSSTHTFSLMTFHLTFHLTAPLMTHININTLHKVVIS